MNADERRSGVEGKKSRVYLFGKIEEKVNGRK